MKYSQKHNTLTPDEIVNEVGKHIGVTFMKLYHIVLHKL